MKKGKCFLIIASSIVLIAALCIGIVQIKNSIIYNRLESTEVEVTPSVDFVQPYLFAHEEGEEYDYDSYFSFLSDSGYDTIIVQMCRTEEADGSSTFYYPTTIDESLTTLSEYDYSYILEELLTACDEHDFNCYIGLSVEEYTWWTLTCYYNKDYMNRVADIDCYMIDEIYNLYNHHKCFVGWYYAFELFSNPVGFERKWAKPVNKVIDKLNEIGDGRPMIISPFRHVQVGLVTNEYWMWRTFFRLVNFREGDIFAPQDSMGKLNQNRPVSKNSYRHIYMYLKSVDRAVKHEKGLKYWVNVELFQKENGEEYNVGDFDRIIVQIKNANRVTDKIVTFSASHYMYQNGTNDTQEKRIQFSEKYQEFLKSINK